MGNYYIGDSKITKCYLGNILVSFPDNTDYTITLSDGITLDTIMFNDDFDGNAIGSTWKAAYGHDNSALTNWWTADTKNIGVSNSCLRLTMLRDNPTTDYDVSSAKVETMQHGGSDNYGFDTGYCEVKFKLDKVGQGIWVAIWCVGQTQTDKYTDITDTSVTRTIHGLSWPWAGEIDQMDAMMSSFTPGLIYQDDPYINAVKTLKGNVAQSLEANQWYTIGLYKSKSVIKVYLDRTLISSFDITGNTCFSGMGEKLILNLSTGTVGGTLPDGINEVNMYVDYVRVYSLSDTYTLLKNQNTSSLLPDYANGYSVVAGRSWLLRPQFADNTKNTALNWASSDPTIAKVENGYVTSIQNGNCNITATDTENNKVIEFALEVKANAGVLADKIIVTSSQPNIEASGSTEITAKIYPTQCDVLTPVLSIISGSDYCEINGTTITNTNTTGESQTATIRVGTNNTDVYEDVEITLIAADSSDYTVSVTDGIKYDFKPVSAKLETVGAYVKWTDSVNDKILAYDNTSFDGLKLISTNALDSITVPSDIKSKAVIINESSGTLISVFSNISANSGFGYIISPTDYVNDTKTGHYTGIYFNGADNARIREMPEDGNYSAAWINNISLTAGEIIVVAIKFSNRTVKYSIYNGSGLLGTTGDKDATNITDESGNIGALYAGSSSRGNGIKGNTYRHIVYNRALSDEEILTLATELITMHKENA